MKFFVGKDQRVHFDEIPPVLVEWIRRLPETIDSWTLSDNAESRLFPLPASGSEGELINEDWKAYTQPELHEWFRSTRSIVAEDVKDMQKNGDHQMLGIPLAHVDAWLNALNQARLVLTELHHLTEKDLGDEEIHPENEQKAMAVMQVGFFGMMQECLLAQTDAFDSERE